MWYVLTFWGLLIPTSQKYSSSYWRGKFDEGKMKFARWVTRSSSAWAASWVNRGGRGGGNSIQFVFILGEYVCVKRGSWLWVYRLKICITSFLIRLSQASQTHMSWLLYSYSIYDNLISSIIMSLIMIFLCWCNVLRWIRCLWCYSECISTPGKLEKYAWPRWESNLRPLEY
jgi:hypothetical protein